MSTPTRGFGTLVAIPVIGLVIGFVGSQAVRKQEPPPSTAEQPVEERVAALEQPNVSERQPAEHALAPTATPAVEPEPEIETERATGPVDERKVDWLRAERTKLESLIATSDDLEDRRIWSQVKQLIGPTYSCVLERQGRGVSIERASATQIDGSHGVSSDGHDLVYLGFGMAFHMDYSEFPSMKELVDTAGAMTGFPSDGELTTDANALASRLALFCARIDSEL